MIQLIPQQVAAVAASGEMAPTLIGPATQTAYVLVRKEIYEQLTSDEYDDSPWTSEERHALAWEAGKHAGWDEMDEYDEDDELEQP